MPVPFSSWLKIDSSAIELDLKLLYISQPATTVIGAVGAGLKAAPTAIGRGGGRFQTGPYRRFNLLQLAARGLVADARCRGRGGLELGQDLALVEAEEAFLVRPDLMHIDLLEAGV